MADNTIEVLFLMLNVLIYLYGLGVEIFMRYKMYVHAFAYMGLNVHLCVAIPDANLPILIHLKCITRIHKPKLPKA